jgi:hypothetical protein
MNKKKSPIAKLSDAKLVSWEREVPKSVFPLQKGSRAGVVVDRNGLPQLFIFDTFALLDVLSEIDEQLVDRLSNEEYHSKTVNPAGWLIDEIESRLPVNPLYANELLKGIEEAKRKGFIPFERIKAELSL